MKLISEEVLLSTIEEALELNKGEISIDSSMENTDSWDSLGAIQILSALDILTEGKSSENIDFSEAGSCKEILDALKKLGLIED